MALKTINDKLDTNYRWSILTISVTDKQALEQTDIFYLCAKYPNFAELSNALYEREIKTLGNSTISDPDLLKRKLKGLNYHVRNLCIQLLERNAPIDIDVHNASWQAKQNAKCPLSSQHPDKTLKWLAHSASEGQIVPVYVENMGEQHIELDCIDIMASDRVHLNKFGWFSKSGEYFEIVPKQSKFLLLKPTKSIFVAACGGHRWSPRGPTIPRTLSLRELLLSTQINWKKF